MLHGIKKTKTIIDQFQLFVTMRSKRIPPNKSSKSFTSLPVFQWTVMRKNQSYVDRIDKLLIKCLHQSEIIQRCVISKLSHQKRKPWQYIRKDQYYQERILKNDHAFCFQLKVKSLTGMAFSIWKNNAVLSASLWILFHPPTWFNFKKWLLCYLTILKTLPGGTLSTVPKRQLNFKDEN